MNMDHANIFELKPADFASAAIALFRFQYAGNAVYRAYVDALQIDAQQVDSLERIPFLPISFFKTHEIKTTAFSPELSFESSGTTQTLNSKHDVKDASLYRKSFFTCFEYFYGSLNNLRILALLPSYLERKNSSLVYMADALIHKAGLPGSGFYLYNHDDLRKKIEASEAAGETTVLLGVTFALLDFAAACPMELRHTVVIETGGMKGRKKEMTREEVHAFLCSSFQVEEIHSEYGMTELLSQAWSKGDGVFEAAPWMKMFVREEDDPFHITETGSGLLNIIDLANRYSCAFIATDDAGKISANGSFEVIGRLDNSDIRGCSLLVI